MSLKRDIHLPWYGRIAFERLELLLLTGFAILSVGLGFVGFSAILDPADYSWPTVFHKSLQLLILEGGDFKEPTNWCLFLGRFLGSCVFGFAIIKSLILIFLKPNLAAKNHSLVSRLSGHSIVCGYGTLGASIATDWANRGKIVAVLDKDLHDEDYENLVRRGVAVIKGDATDSRNLFTARIEKASVCVVCCGGDGANSAVAMAAMRCRSESKSGDVIELLTQIRDDHVFTLLRDFEKKFDAMDRVNLKKFDMVAISSRSHLLTYPLDHMPISSDSELFIQVVFAGWSVLSEGILKAMALQCHMPNLIRARVVLAFEGAAEVRQNILFKFPQIINIVDLVESDLSPSSSLGASRIREMASEKNAVTTIFLSSGEDDATLRTAMGLRAVLHGINLPLFLVSWRPALLRPLFADHDESPRLGVFGISDPASELARQRAGQTVEKIAQALHHVYLNEESRKRQNNPQAGPPGESEVPWQRLTEEYRSENRENARHWEFKLRAVGRELVQAVDHDFRPTAELTAEEIEILSILEHQRWNASKWLQGWQWGPERDNSKKLHNLLVPYSELSEENKDKDRQTIRALLAELDNLGSRMVRANRKWA